MPSQKTPSYLELFRSFFWLGLTGFGGLAMTAHIRKYIVDKKEWIDGEAFDSGLALCQVIPGAIVMQLAAYIGLKLKGIAGAVVCFIGFGLPAFIIMFVLSVLYKHSKNIRFVEGVLQGLRVIIVAIVANAAYLFGRKYLKNINDGLIVIIAAALFLTKLHPFVVILFAAMLGLVLTKKETTEPTDYVQVKTLRFLFILILLVLAGVSILYVLKKEYFTLATIMLRIDLFSFGGGLAATPIMYHELVDLFAWFDEKTFMDGIILGQVTPGSIIISATFFGYMHLGVWGSLIATICVFTPSFLILLGIIPFFQKLQAYPQFNRVVNGVLCSFVGLLLIITYRFFVGVHWDIVHIIFALIAFVLLIRKVDVIWVIMGGVILFSLL
jgi:chromate transporter